MTRRSALVAGIVCLGAVAVLGVLVVAAPGIVQHVDDAWHLEMGEWRSPALVGFALVMNGLGGGWIATFVIPLGLAVVLLLVRGWRSAAFALAAFLASAGLVQLIKHAVGRPRPQDLLVASDFGSFPSGHAANAATIAVVLCLLFPNVLSVIGGALWVTAMAFSRTVLSVHWFSDVVGGTVAGVGTALVVAAAVWPCLVRGRTGGGASSPPCPATSLARLDGPVVSACPAVSASFACSASCPPVPGGRRAAHPSVPSLRPRRAV